MDNKIKLLKKIKHLQEVMGNMEWEKDGKNTNQRYKYITEAQYKNNFNKALKEVGLLWKMEEISKEFMGQISASMHLVFVDFNGYLIDPETGESMEYRFSGSGADMGDKALYKAYTGGLKYFLASNFLVAEYNDPEQDVKSTPKYVSPDKRENIKSDLTGGKATKMQVEALKKQLKMIVEKDPSKKDLVLKVAKDTNEFKKISKKECEDYIIKFGKMLKGD